MRILILSVLLVGVFATNTQDFGSSNNKFAVGLFNKIFSAESLQDDSNIFFSPFSTTAALCMTMLGAKEDTLSQIKEVLHIKELEDPHQTLTTLIKELEDGDNTVAIANKIFGQTGFNFLSDFLQKSEEFYDAKLEQVDFSEPEVARRTINDWVEEKTMNKIKDLIPSGTLSASVALVLTNAIYFQANWTDKFVEAKTHDTSFYSSGQSSTIKMMERTGSYNYVDDAKLKSQIIEIPFNGEDFSYYVILPYTNTHVKTLQDSLTHENIASGIQSLESTMVKLNLPKFEITEDLKLAQILRSMGMIDLFSSEANLTGIAKDAELAVSDVLHKAFIKVNR